MTALEKAIAAAEAAKSSATVGTAPTQIATPIIESRDARSVEGQAKSGAGNDLAASILGDYRRGQSVFEQVVEQNKDAAKSAAKFAMGDVVLKQTASRLGGFLPAPVKMFLGSDALNTPIGRVVVANVIALALKQLRPGGIREEQVAEAVMYAAGVDLAQSFDINGIIDEILDGVMPSAAN